MPGLPDAGLRSAGAMEQRCFEEERLSTKSAPRRRPTVSLWDLRDSLEISSSPYRLQCSDKARAKITVVSPQLALQGA